MTSSVNGQKQVNMMDKLVLVKIKEDEEYLVVPDEKKHTFPLNNAPLLCEYIINNWGRVINYEDKWSHMIGYDTFQGNYLSFMELYQWISMILNKSDDEDLTRLHKWMSTMLYALNIEDYFIYYIGNSPQILNRLSEKLLKNYKQVQYNKLDVPLYSKRMMFEKVLRGELHYNDMEIEFHKNIPDSTITQEELEEQYWDYALKLFFGSMNKEYTSLEDV